MIKLMNVRGFRSIGLRLWRGRPESRILLIFLALVVIAFGFGKAASEVMEGEALAFDRAVLLALRDPHDLSVPIGPAWLRQAITDLTSLGSFAVLAIVTAFAAGYLLVIRQRTLALFTVGSVVLGALLNTGLKEIYARSRPDLVEHLVGTASASFPSGHAMNSATVFLTLAVLVAKGHTSWRVRVYLIAAAITLTLLVGFSRVYLGVHWPTDVLAGWGVGSAWAALCSVAASAFPSRPERDGA